MYNTAIYIRQSVIILAIAGLASCSNSEGNPARSAGETAKQYITETITPQAATLYTQYPATLEGREIVEIRPRIEGYVEKVYVDEGSTVKKGQLLFIISNPQYEQDLRTAEAGIKTAQADVSAAQLTVNKIKPLVDKDIISKFELESAEYTLQAKKAALAQAQATLANARTNVGYTRITSPVNGIIGTLPHKTGSLVSGSSTDPLTTISSTGDMYAYFSLNEKQLLDLSRRVPGSSIQQKLQRLPKATLLLADNTIYDQPGSIETVNGFIDTETGSASLRATFPNPMGILRSGNSGTIRIPQQMDSALVIPQSATYDLQGKRFVYVVNPDSTVKNRSITVTATPDGKSFVVTDGVTPGETIVTEGVNGLSDGTRISPVKK